MPPWPIMAHHGCGTGPRKPQKLNLLENHVKIVADTKRPGASTRVAPCAIEHVDGSIRGPANTSIRSSLPTTKSARAAKAASKPQAKAAEKAAPSPKRAAAARPCSRCQCCLTPRRRGRRLRRRPPIARGPAAGGRAAKAASEEGLGSSSSTSSPRASSKGTRANKIFCAAMN